MLLISRDCTHATQDKIRAIQEAPRPKNLAELRSFLGLINYYSNFLPQISTKLKPLYNLLRKNTVFRWGTSQDLAFEAAKAALQEDSFLAHYDSTKPLVLACDASPYGLGAVLSHILDEGQERPVAFVSRTVTTAEQKYSQLEKEALAIIFGVT